MSFVVEDENQPVTVVVSQLVKPGREQAYEQWVKGISNAALKFYGHLGTSILRPQQGSRPEYVIVFKFDRYVNLKKWMESDIRQKWLAQSNRLVQDAPTVQQLSGMETWFTLPGQSPKRPPLRYKMSILTWVAVYVLLNILTYVLAPVLRGFPMFIGQLIISGLMVVLLTYVVLPQITRLFYKWLYPN